MFSFKNNLLQRFLSAALMLGGILLMWLAPEVGVGALLFASGVVVELVAVRLEQQRRHRH